MDEITPGLPPGIYGPAVAFATSAMGGSTGAPNSPFQLASGYLLSKKGLLLDDKDEALLSR
jgi:hypothetical protein